VIAPQSPLPRSSLYVALPKPPTAFSLTVRKLVGRVVEGAIRVPEFQRPLRWERSDVIKLFDSILKGYPVGSLLFWKRSFEPGEVMVGSARFEAPAVQDGWFIIDGQQRTTALAAALSDLSQAGDRRWGLRFDPISGQFIEAEGAGVDASRHVPLSALGDLRRLGHWLRDCGLSEGEQSHVESVQQRILDYELPAYLLETEDVDALRGVFARMNSTGVRMRADEVFQALLGGAPRPRKGSIDLGALQVAADLDGFGQPPRAEILKCVLAMSGLDPARRLEDLGDEATANLVSSDDAGEAIRRAVAFLQSPMDGDSSSGAGMPAYAFVPYPVVLVLLCRWFHVHPEPDGTTRRALARWVWRGVASGVHQRAAVSVMRFQAREIREDDMGRSLAALLGAVGEPTTAEWKLEPFNARRASSRVELLALLSLGPRSQLGEVSWRALVSDGQRVAREIFPMTELEGSARMLGRTAANRVLLDTRYTGMSAHLRTWNWDQDHVALQSHLIDEEGLELLEAAREDSSARQSFLSRRASRVRAEVTRFLGRRAGAGQPIVLPITAYAEDDEPHQ